MVKLIAKTQFIDTNAVEFPLTSEEFIIYIARVTSDKKNKKEKALNLLKYLFVNQHLSPFQHVFFTFEIETTRDIARQIFRHDFERQEFSQRYSSNIDIEIPELRKKAKTNRQGSLEELASDEGLEDLLNQVKGFYFELVNERGVAPESARKILPENTKTKIFITTHARNYFFYLASRLDKEFVQKEHYEIALQIKDALAIELPELMKFLDVYMECHNGFKQDMKTKIDALYS